jgi:hypothetical protein
MSVRSWLLPLLFVLSLPSAASAEIEEFAARQRTVEAANALYESESFEELDRQLDKLLREKSRSPSGLWLSGVFHVGMHPDEAVPHDESEWLAQRDRARRWIGQHPQSANAWLNLAEVVFDHATAIGCGRCTVVDESKRSALYAAELQSAKLQFEEAWRRGSTDPQYFTQMIHIALRQRRTPEELDRLLAELADRSPAYYPAWFAAVDFYKASDPEHARARIDELARRAMAASAGTEGQSLYARIWWYAAQSGGFELFGDEPVDWDLFDAAFRDVMKRYPDDWNRNNYASFACQAGHPERARELMFGHEPVADAWESFEAFQACIPATLDT